jgi:hypothetical protein
LPVVDALSSIDGQYDLVLTYDASDAVNPWKMFDPAAPPFANDLPYVRPLLGYWIHMTGDGVLTVENP